MLAGVDDWQFDAFRLEAASGGRPLSCLAFFLMKRTELVERFHLEETKLANFLMVNSVQGGNGDCSAEQGGCRGERERSCMW